MREEPSYNADGTDECVAFTRGERAALIVACLLALAFLLLA